MNMILKKLMSRKNLSQRKLARLTDLHQPRLSVILSGKRPTATEAERLEKFFQLPITLLLERDE